jgi:polyisoprenoid-binding protein YceI
MATIKWALDATHSELHFKVRHLVVSNVSGQFKSFSATAETDGDNITTAKAHFTAEVDSISTNNEQRDGHLKTGDFFDAENHPQIIFDGAGLTKVEGEHYHMTGTLTMRGVSKPIIVNVEYGGMIVDPWGHNRVGFAVTGKVNRKDFGVSFGMVSETGAIMLGEEVSFSGNFEFTQVVETAA